MQSKKEGTLSRELSLRDLIGIGVGSVIGSGIFILFGTILRLGGNSTFLALILAAIPNILTALAYAELSSMYQQNDVEYKSVEDAFSKEFAKVTTYVLLLFMVFNTATVLLFVGHLFSFVSKDAFLVTLPILLVLSIVNYIGIKTSKSITNVMAVVEITMLIIVSLFAAPFWKSARMCTMPSTNIKHSFWLASFLGLFLFTGYDSIVKMTDETQDPGRNIPWALVGTLTLVTLIYLGAALSATSISNKGEHAFTSPIRHLWEHVIHSKSAWIVTVVGICIVLNTAFIGTISMSRFIYGLSKDGQLPSFLDDVNPRFKTPHNAIIAVFIAFAVTLLVYNPEKTALLSNLFFLIFMIVMMANVIILRIKQPEKERPFKIKGMTILMSLGILLCMFYICLGITHFHNV